MQRLSELVNIELKSIKNNVQGNQPKMHVKEINSNNTISRFMKLHNLECDLYDEILELSIADSKKDSICDKLNMLLNSYEEVINE